MPVWKKSDIQFKDGRNAYDSTVKKEKGYYTRNEIIDLAQKEANILKANNKDAMIGVAYHFKNTNQYVPAKMTSVSDPVRVWNVDDSDKGHAYDGDVIDEIHFILIKRDDVNPNPDFLKPKGANNYNRKVFTKKSFFGPKKQ